MQIMNSLDRSNVIQNLTNTQWDLLVIGGGVTGSGIALDAASRGLKVALIEMYDYASGTSSRSTKLIHGGLRYLKQFEIQLVREVGRERAIVHDLAPHLVLAEKMLLPLVEGGTYGKLATSVGLMVYDFLAGVEGKDRRQMLSKEATLGHEPLLREDIVVGGGYYAEYRTDDARLTVEILKTAVQYGACPVNYIKATGFETNDEGIITAVKCQDMLTNEALTISCQTVISAAGPWVDHIRKEDQSLTGKRLFLSKGVHIVVPHDRLPVKQSIYFDVPDGRMIFAIPRQRITYIGTTDTPYQGDPSDVKTNQEDADYLLKAVNNIFPDIHLTSEDIVSSWAGLRPLIHEEGKSSSEISRKDEIFESDSGLLSIAGGKLTGYRKMSERVVDLAIERFKKTSDKVLKDCHTDTIPLIGGPFKDESAVNQYVQEINNTLDQLGVPAGYGPYLVHNYGRQTDQILGYMNQFDEIPEIKVTLAEVLFCMQEEQVLTCSDFFIRRSGRLYFQPDRIESVIEPVAQFMATQLGQDEDWVKEEVQDVKQQLFEAAHFEYSSSEVAG